MFNDTVVLDSSVCTGMADLERLLRHRDALSAELAMTGPFSFGRKLELVNTINNLEREIETISSRLGIALAA